MWESKFLKINTSIAGDTLQILGLKSLLEILEKCCCFSLSFFFFFWLNNLKVFFWEANEKRYIGKEEYIYYANECW